MDLDLDLDEMDTFFFFNFKYSFSLNIFIFCYNDDINKMSGVNTTSDINTEERDDELDLLIFHKKNTKRAIEKAFREHYFSNPKIKEKTRNNIKNDILYAVFFSFFRSEMQQDVESLINIVYKNYPYYFAVSKNPSFHPKAPLANPHFRSILYHAENTEQTFEQIKENGKQNKCVNIYIFLIIIANETTAQKYILEKIHIEERKEFVENVFFKYLNDKIDLLIKSHINEGNSIHLLENFVNDAIKKYIIEAPNM